ncbi:alpha/beta hydrolase [Bounagaea algeriensis]
MTLNTFVAGNPGEARSFAQELRKFGEHTETAATGAHQSHTRAAGEWEGAASEAFQGWAKQQGTDGDALAEVAPAAARAHDTLADELDTVKARMEQAKQVARDGELTVRAYTIMPPTPFTAVKPDKPKGRMSAAESERYSNDLAVFEAAQARQAKQQAAYEEAKTTIEGARQKERTAHETFVNSLDRAKGQLKGISQAEKWAQAGVHPSSAAAGGLAQAATAMESSAEQATKHMFERAAGNSPAAVNAVWSSMSSAQRADLTDRFPKMVGSADGVPAMARHQANRRLLGEQRQNLRKQIRFYEQWLDNTQFGEDDARKRTRYSWRLDQLRNAEEGLDKVENLTRDGNNRYLLSLDSAENYRGQVIIASGNPDTADHVSTTVPGTYSSLGNAVDYVHNGEKVIDQAQQRAPGESFSSVTYIDYESPESLVTAGSEHYAEQGSKDLAQFQEGLRATHDGSPSHNSIISHSYGTTEVGYAARDHGVHADDIVFMGSPGVGVDHASELGVQPHQVWSGTGGVDPIKAAGSGNPLDLFEPGADRWYGRDPSADEFGARELPTKTLGGHLGYWDSEKTVDGLARVVAGK